MPRNDEHRPEVVALGGVVVDDVEDHLDAGAVQRLHHPLELAHLLAARAGRGVERVRREVADRAVAPVVRQARGRRGSSSSAMWWIGSSSTAVTPSEREVLDRRLRREARRTCRAGPRGRARCSFVKPLTCSLVDDRLVSTGGLGGRSSSQSKRSSTTTHFGIASASSSSSASRSASSPSGTYGSTFAAP